MPPDNKKRPRAAVAVGLAAFSMPAPTTTGGRHLATVLASLVVIDRCHALHGADPVPGAVIRVANMAGFRDVVCPAAALTADAFAATLQASPVHLRSLCVQQWRATAAAAALAGESQLLALELQLMPCPPLLAPGFACLRNLALSRVDNVDVPSLCRVMADVRQTLRRVSLVSSRLVNAPLRELAPALAQLRLRGLDLRWVVGQDTPRGHGADAAEVAPLIQGPPERWRLRRLRVWGTDDARTVQLYRGFPGLRQYSGAMVSSRGAAETRLLLTTLVDLERLELTTSIDQFGNDGLPAAFGDVSPALVHCRKLRHLNLSTTVTLLAATHLAAAMTVWPQLRTLRLLRGRSAVRCNLRCAWTAADRRHTHPP
jgi:hypothetical protein